MLYLDMQWTLFKILKRNIKVWELFIDYQSQKLKLDKIDNLIRFVKWLWESQRLFNYVK